MEEMQKKIINKKSWDEFRESGLLWFANMVLHAFGWAIVTEVENGKVVDAYPARVGFRGFGVESQTAGYIKVSKYMAENAAELLDEAEH